MWRALATGLVVLGIGVELALEFRARVRSALRSKERDAW